MKEFEVYVTTGHDYTGYYSAFAVYEGRKIIKYSKSKGFNYVLDPDVYDKHLLWIRAISYAVALIQPLERELKLTKADTIKFRLNEKTASWAQKFYEDAQKYHNRQHPSLRYTTTSKDIYAIRRTAEINRKWFGERNSVGLIQRFKSAKATYKFELISSGDNRVIKLVANKRYVALHIRDWQERKLAPKLPFIAPTLDKTFEQKRNTMQFEYFMLS